MRFVVSEAVETCSSCFNRVIDRRCKGRRLQPTWETTTSFAQFGQYRPEVKCRTELHFRARFQVGRSRDEASVSVHHRWIVESVENYNDRPQWWIRLVFYIWCVFPLLQEPRFIYHSSLSSLRKSSRQIISNNECESFA